jgi:Protein of unknown function (DUF3099)
VKFGLPSRRTRGVYTVTDARRSMSEDISYRQRRYLISMGIRVVAFLLAVFLFHGVWRFIAAAVALVVPYFAVVFANGGREPDNSAAFEPFDPNLPQRLDSATGPAGAHDAAGTGAPAARGADARGADAAGGATAHAAAPDDAAGRHQTGGNAGGHGHPGRPEENREGEAFLSRKQADTRS